MRVGEVLLLLVFNLVVIFGLYLWQTRLLRQKMGQVKQEIQELEDLVVAIVEEFGEAVPVDQTATGAEVATASGQEVKAATQSVGQSSAKKSSQVSKVRTKNPKASPAGAQIQMVATEQPPQAIMSMAAVPQPEPQPVPMSEVREELIPSVKPKTRTRARTKPKDNEAAPQKAVDHSQNNAPEQPDVSVAAPQSDGRFSGVAPESKQQKVLNLAQQGMEVAEIAKQLQMGQGEIQLILGLNKKG